MTAVKPCRRCAECKGMSHHWLDNPDFGNDEDPDAESPDAEYACKHCDATGDECSGCGSFGEVTDRTDRWITCKCCDGEGVIEKGG